ncbi:MAG: hypothetical protein HC909_02440 [Blastochloris sp.]|nr:hypothetical protein [Blastochloris sp.]
MAIANGLDDNQTVLLKLARLPADQQLEQLEEILALRQELKAARAEPAQVRNAAELEAVKASIDQRVREAEERGAAAAQETIARLEQEMQDIRAAADAKTHELETTLARVQAEVEVAAKQHAEALAVQAIASRKDELDKLNKEIAASQQRLDRSRESQARVQKEIAEHQTYLNKISSDEYAARMQSDLAGKLAKALNDAMLELADLESEPQPVAMRQLSRAAELCRRMAEALETFLAPRLTANVVTLHS